MHESGNESLLWPWNTPRYERDENGMVSLPEGPHFRRPAQAQPNNMKEADKRPEKAEPNKMKEPHQRPDKAEPTKPPRLTRKERCRKKKETISITHPLGIGLWQ